MSYKNICFIFAAEIQNVGSSVDGMVRPRSNKFKQIDDYGNQQHWKQRRHSLECT